MKEPKDGKRSSGSEDSVVDIDNFIASVFDFYSSSDISTDVKMDGKEKKKVKEGIKRKTKRKKPSSVTSSQGRRSA
eukprot:2324908-Ditylum_brightwellii.AAC.1